MGELDVKALVDTPADKISEKKAEIFASTLGHVDFDALLNTLAHTLAELQFKKRADKLCDVKVLALVHVLAYIQAGKKGKTLAANPGEKLRLRH